MLTSKFWCAVFTHFPLQVFFDLCVILELCCLISKYLETWDLLFIYTLFMTRQHTRYSLHPLTLLCFSTEIRSIFTNAPYARPYKTKKMYYALSWSTTKNYKIKLANSVKYSTPLLGFIFTCYERVLKSLSWQWLWICP